MPQDDELNALRTALEDLQEEIRLLRERLEGKVKEFRTVEEVGKLTGRAPYTVRSWIREGRIVAQRVSGTGPRGRLLIPESELRKLMESGLGGEIPPVAVGSRDS